MLFVDSTDPVEIEAIYGWGVVCGVTTNPLIFAREAKTADLETRIREVVAVSHGPVAVELTSEDAAEMLTEAERYHAWAPDRGCTSSWWRRHARFITRSRCLRHMHSLAQSVSVSVEIS